MTPNKFFKSRFYKLFLVAFCFAQILWIQHGMGQSKIKKKTVHTLIKTYNSDSSNVIDLIKEANKYSDRNIDSSIYLIIEAHKIAKRTNSEKLLAMTFTKLGWYYLLKGNYPKALESNFMALQINEMSSEKVDVIINLSSIGNIYVYQADYDKALNYFLSALNKSEEINKKYNTVSALINIGIVYLYKAEYSKALQYNFKALKIAEKEKYNELILTSYANIGIAFYEEHEFSKALDYYFKALKISEELNDNYYISMNVGNIGSLYTKQKNFKGAFKYLYRALALSNRIGAMDHIKERYTDLSDLYEQTNIPLPDSIGGKVLTMEQTRLRSNYYLKRAFAIKDSLFSQENKKELVRKEMNYEFDKKETATKAETEKQQALAAEKNRKQTIISWSIAGGLLLVLLFSGFVLRSLRITRQQKSVIESQKNEVSKQKEIADSQRIIAEELREIAVKQKHIVEEKQKEIVDSITYAKRIQTALLTSSSYINEHLPAEHFILFKPKDIVSGDFYWALSVPPLPGWDMGTNKIKLTQDQTRRNTFYLATADCTGHGVPGAFMSMLNISYLNENVIERGIRLPHDILNAQRNEIINALNPIGSTEVSKDGMDCILCVYDFNKMLLHFAAANNPLWLVRNGQLTEYKADKMPVGKYSENITSFTLQTIELQKGDTIYTATDGFADQFGVANGKKMMKKIFKEELLKIHHQPMDEQKQHLAYFFEAWRGNTEQVDDVCVIGVRI